MSLFKLRDLWSTRCGIDEVFEGSSLEIADLTGSGTDFIIVGSHSGVLRIFHPFSDIEPLEATEFKPTDVLLETQLPRPILQVSAGRFVSGSKSLHLAILHPRSVAVYTLMTVSGTAEHGDQSQLYLAYEHQLKRAGFCMITGGFGGVDGRDFVCVQGLDGTIMFFEQETLALSRTVPKFLLPSPMVYVPHTDSFVLFNSNWILESYRYQTLGEDVSKPLTPSWTYNLGEDISNMRYLLVTTTEAAIVILGERNLYCFRENGVMQFCKRLQYTPLCMHVFSRGEADIMTIIATDSNDLLVYERTTLKWAAQLNSAPVSVSRAKVKVVEGALVLLSEEGELQICYLGTEPTVFVAPPVQSSVANMSDVENRLTQLKNEIANFNEGKQNPLEGGPVAQPDVKLNAKIWQHQVGDSTCKIEISLKAVTLVNNVHVNLYTPPPFSVEPQSHYLQSLSDTSELYCTVSVEDKPVIGWDLDMSVLVTYTTSDSRIGTARTVVILPLTLLIEVTTPSKDFNHKLTFTVSQPVHLSSIFSEFQGDAWTAAGCTDTSVSFRFKNNSDTPLQISLNKTTLKYRFETDNLRVLTLPLTALLRKLGNKKLETSQHSLVMKDLNEEIDKYVKLRNELKRYHKDELQVGASQMRLVEKRLLTKLRDKTPSNIDHLHTLLVDTHEYIMEVSNKIEQADRELELTACSLGSLIKLLTTLLKHNGSSLGNEVDELHNAMSNTLHKSEDQSWAEITFANVSFMLRTTLAKSLREQQRAVIESQRTVTDSTQLKKFISTAVDRVAKGKRHFDDRAVSPILEGDVEDEIEIKERPRFASVPALYGEGTSRSFEDDDDEAI